MQDEEVADALELESRLAVVALDQHRTEAAVGHEVEQSRDPGLDQIDAGRLERLHETARQPDGYAIAIPEFPAHSGREFQDAWLCQRPPVQVRHERLTRDVIRDVGARIDVAVAGPML